MKLPLSLLAWLLVTGTVVAADLPEYTLVLKDHLYSPSELRVPAGGKFKLVVDNQDPTPEEFESNDFNREMIVLPHHRIEVYVGPLQPGTYTFFGDFHQDTARGRLIVE